MIKVAKLTDSELQFLKIVVETIDLAAFVKTLRDDHLLCVPAAENTLRLLPPLTISRDEIDLAVAKIATVLNDIFRLESQ